MAFTVASAGVNLTNIKTKHELEKVTKIFMLHNDAGV